MSEGSTPSPPAGPRRVLLVAPESTGGIGAHVADLAAGLVGAGREVVVAAPSSLARRLDLGATGARHLPLVVGQPARPPQHRGRGGAPPGRAAADARALRPLRRELAGADVAHAHGWRAAAVTALAGGGRSCPLVVTVHNPLPHTGALPDLLARLVLSRAALVLAGTADLAVQAAGLGAGEVEAAVLAAPATPCPDPAEVTLVRRRLAGPGRPLVAAVARLAPQKGLDLLLDAVAALVGEGRGPTPVVAVAGEGPLRERLQRRIDAEALPVRLLGACDRVPVLLAAADLVVCPSRWEGPSFALQEALRCGRAVVAADVGGVADLVAGAALLVPGDDPVALAHGIQQVLGDVEQRKSLERKAVARAGQLPDRAGVVAAALAAYQRAASR